MFVYMVNSLFYIFVIYLLQIKSTIVRQNIMDHTLQLCETKYNYSKIGRFSILGEPDKEKLSFWRVFSCRKGSNLVTEFEIWHVPSQKNWQAPHNPLRQVSSMESRNRSSSSDKHLASCTRASISKDWPQFSFLRHPYTP